MVFVVFFLHYIEEIQREDESQEMNKHIWTEVFFFFFFFGDSGCYFALRDFVWECNLEWAWVVIRVLCATQLEQKR